MSNTITLPGGIILTLPANLSGFSPTPTGAQPFTLPQLQLPLNLPNLPQGLPDLSGILPLLSPLLAMIPGAGPFIPLIGALFQVAHVLSTQMHATAASGTGTPDSLKLVHDAFWQQIHAAFAPPQASSSPTSG